MGAVMNPNTMLSWIKFTSALEQYLSDKLRFFNAILGQDRGDLLVLRRTLISGSDANKQSWNFTEKSRPRCGTPKQCRRLKMDLSNGLSASDAMKGVFLWTRNRGHADCAWRSGSWSIPKIVCTKQTWKDSLCNANRKFVWSSLSIWLSIANICSFYSEKLQGRLQMQQWHRSWASWQDLRGPSGLCLVPYLCWCRGPRSSVHSPPRGDRQ